MPSTQRELPLLRLTVTYDANQFLRAGPPC